jgi:subtilase family serine protease
MKTLAAFSILLLAVSVSAIPLMAQAPDASRLYVHSTVSIVPTRGNPTTPTGIVPVQYKAAYGFNRLPNQGQGQTIGVVVAYDAPNIQSDLAAYASYFHLAPCNLQKVMVGNPAQRDGLDASVGVEQACALAPQANIVLVEANTDSLSDMLQAIAVASSSPYNATVVSIAYALEEFAGERQFDSYFCGVHNGNGQAVTFLAPTSSCSGRTGVYPAASPCVLAVGGTSLGLSTPLPLPNPLSSDYGFESVWNGSVVSPYEPQPAWQSQACSPYSTTNRCTPDITADADLNTGVAIYDTSYGGWIEVGGDGVSTSDWAAFFTLVNSVRAGQGNGPLSQPAADLYAIYNSSDYANDFHDIRSGGNGCLAEPGYDLGSGIGSYQANNLYSTLAAEPN